MTTVNVELTKLLLVACDQAYFTATSLAGALEPLDDKSSTDPAYGNPLIYSSFPLYNWASNYRVHETIVRSDTGAKLVIYKNGGDIIVAFGGTDGISAQDWTTNTQDVGWNQWSSLVDPQRGNLFGVLADLRSSLGGQFSGIHFTGQSLGGALAQYAAYEYVVNERKTAADKGEIYDPSKVTLTTFNALGAKWGLDAHGGYVDSVLNGLGQAVHYVVDNDVVWRLGGGHIGTGGNVVKFDWTYSAGEHAGKPLDVVDAHRIETAFYTHIMTGDEFAATTTAEGTDLINAKGAVAWAGILGNLMNNETVGPVEGIFRLTMGLVSAGIAANPDEVNAVAQAFVAANHKAGKISDEMHGFLSSLNLGWVAKAALFNKAGLALYLGSLFGSVFIDFVDAAAGGAQKFFQSVGGFIGELISGSTMPQADIKSEADAIAKLKAALLSVDQTSGMTEEERIKVADQISQATIGAGANWVPAAATALAKGLTATKTYLAMSIDERGKTLGEAIGSLAGEIASVAKDHDDAVLKETLVAGLTEFTSTDLGKALAKLNPDYLKQGDSAIQIAGVNTVGDRLGFIDGVLTGLREVSENLLSLFAGTAQAETIKDEMDQATDQIRQSAQTIILSPDRSGNPFQGGGEVETDGIAQGDLKEGRAKSYTLYLPYAVGADGQTIRLKITGGETDKLVALYAGRQIDLGGGEFEIEVRAGSREVSFGLWAKDDTDTDATLQIEAQLLDAEGQASHKQHLEAKLQLDADSEEDREYDRVIRGDLEPVDTAPDVEGIQIRLDDLFNPEFTATPQPGREDFFYDSVGRDDIQSKEGKDYIEALAGGDDKIDAGGGDDVALGGAGRDEIAGGGGKDIVVGGADDDDLFGGEFKTYADVLTEADGAGGGSEKGDWVDGGEGDDLVAGASQADGLTGGAGEDVGFGDGGREMILAIPSQRHGRMPRKSRRWRDGARVVEAACRSASAKITKVGAGGTTRNDERWRMAA
jgi:hypothetical protein